MNKKTMLSCIAVLALFGIANVYRGEPQPMFQFSESDGGDVLYGAGLGWPMTYLRIPVGKYGHVPVDMFLPGLAVNVGVAAILCLLVAFGLNSFAKFSPKQQPGAA